MIIKASTIIESQITENTNTNRTYIYIFGLTIVTTICIGFAIAHFKYNKFIKLNEAPIKKNEEFTQKNGETEEPTIEQIYGTTSEEQKQIYEEIRKNQPYQKQPAQMLENNLKTSNSAKTTQLKTTNKIPKSENLCPSFKFDKFGHIEYKNNKVSVVMNAFVSYDIDIDIDITNIDSLQKIRDNQKNYHYFNMNVKNDQLIINIQDIIESVKNIVLHENKYIEDINRMKTVNQKYICDFLRIIEAIHELNNRPFEIKNEIVSPGFAFDGFNHITTENNAIIIDIGNYLIRINHNDFFDNLEKIRNKGKTNYYHLISNDDINIEYAFNYIHNMIQKNNNCLNITNITKKSYHDQEMIYDFFKIVEVINDNQFVKDN